MIMQRSKKLALLLALALVVPIFWNMNTTVASAATPKFTKSKVEIVGEGETYQLNIKNKVTGSTYKWSTSKKSVVKVTSKGVLTSVGKGSATVKCKITYPTKKTRTISCKVNVTVPASEVNITNPTLTNGAFVMTLGSTYDFECGLVPATSSDEVYWSVAGGDEACIRVDNAGEGSVTAIKAGKAILRATAATAATATAASKSIIDDAIIIEVVGPSATVNSVEMLSSNQIKVVFDSAVNSSTVIATDNTLSSNIEISMRKDTKGVLASDPGKLSASLATDGKTLTITSANALIGEYGINFTSKILTTTGLALETYYKTISYIDNTAPVILGTIYDDSNLVATILFSEIMDFTDLKVSGVEVVSSTNTTIATLTSVTLSNKSNYIVSADKKSLVINLSKIPSADYNKTFSVVISGVTDAAGNSPSTYTLRADLRIDTSAKAQAQLITLTRTAYNTITATFTRSIQFGGSIQVNGGVSINGVVDSTDNKKVNYTINDAEAGLTGSLPVTIGYWNGYNVATTDTSAQQMYTRYVDFTVDKISPTYTSEYDSATGILTITCNEDVVLTTATGIFSATLVTATEDIIQGNNISYTQIPYTESAKIIKLRLTNMNATGSYTFTIDQGFLKDKFKNPCLSKTVTLSNLSATSSELAGPYLIAQSKTNLSEITLEFAHKLDIISAETESNYTIAGATIVSAVVTKNTSDNGASVLLTVAEGSITATVARPVTVKGVKGYNGSYQAITAFTKSVELIENKKPYYIDPPVFDSTTKNTIRLNFSETIQGDMKVKVTQYVSSGTPIEYTNEATINGNSVYIKLNTIPINGSYLKIEIVTNNIKDTSGNASTTMQTTLGVVVSY